MPSYIPESENNGITSKSIIMETVYGNNNETFILSFADRLRPPRTTLPGNLQMEFDLRRLIAVHQDRVYNQAYRMLGNREDAEEATQDVFLLVHRNRNEFRGESMISTWIYRITANVCITRLRKKQLPTSSLDREFEPDGDTLGDIIPDDTPDPGTIFENEECKKRIRAEVRKLPPKWAMAITLYHFEDRSYEEIADAMDIPKATVATYILRGRQRLAARLAQMAGWKEK